VPGGFEEGLEPDAQGKPGLPVVEQRQLADEDRTQYEATCRALPAGRDRPVDVADGLELAVEALSRCRAQPVDQLPHPYPVVRVGAAAAGRWSSRAGGASL
jgi:hypothetical protein